MTNFSTNPSCVRFTCCCCCCCCIDAVVARGSVLLHIMCTALRQSSKVDPMKPLRAGELLLCAAKTMFWPGGLEGFIEGCSHHAPAPTLSQTVCVVGQCDDMKAVGASDSTATLVHLDCCYQLNCYTKLAVQHFMYLGNGTAIDVLGQPSVILACIDVLTETK